MSASNELSKVMDQLLKRISNGVLCFKCIGTYMYTYVHICTHMCEDVNI